MTEYPDIWSQDQVDSVNYHALQGVVVHSDNYSLLSFDACKYSHVAEEQ